MMRPVAPTAAALALALLPLSANAQDVTLSFGAALSTDYLVSGQSQTGGRPAFQPYVEVGLGGFYAGVWASNVRLDRDRTEVDLYAGFRNSVGALSYDVGYARYFYNRSGNCCGEVLLSLGYAAPYGMTFLGDAAYDPSAEILTASAGAEYVFPAGWSVSAEVGRVEKSRNFWNVGVGMALNEITSLDLRVHDTNISSALVVGTVSFDF
ncbi:TorF family putative porin [Rhodobaculum claviforme]|nr:TorF family putative porin [Rhodobaculum claviforme]